MQDILIIQTDGRGFYEFSDELQSRLAETAVEDGVLHCQCLHTSASLVITENADPAVLRDLEAFMSRWVPDGTEHYEHAAEGPDDMPAHIRSVLTQTTLMVPVRDGELVLGTWQGMYLWEHRARAHRRKILMTPLASLPGPAGN